MWSVRRIISHFSTLSIEIVLDVWNNCVIIGDILTNRGRAMLALFLIAVCIGCFCDVVKYHREGWNLLHLSPYIIIGGLSGWWGIKFWIYAIFY